MTNQEESNQYEIFQPEVHRGPWLVTGLTSGANGVPREFIEDGAVAVAEGKILAVGKYSSIKKEFGHYNTHDHEGRVLTPALINAHCHLELSYFNLANKVQGQKGYQGDPTVWIRDLLAEQEKFFKNSNDNEILALNYARQTLQQMSTEGIALVGDVGNSLTSRNIGDNQSTRVYFLLELLGLTQEAEIKTVERLKNIAADKIYEIGCTAHAPYSTTPTSIQTIKKLAVEQGHIFSIHVAESKQEVEFLQLGTGAFREFLQDRGAWDGSFKIPGKGSVQYLDSLGVIDSKTLCVHTVHVDSTDIEILANKKAKVCLCPGSNRFLGVGKAPVTELLAHGILPALGTDSKASNESLSMWREMRLLREDHPGLSPELVFSMATCGGAEAWGVVSEMGTLEPGKRSLVLAISSMENLYTAQDVFEYLTTAGDAIQAEWLE
jgi:cytosine/adenosine deaminase-related metal-dependent hydrolase